MFSQQIFGRFNKTIADAQPDKFRWAAIQQASLLEVRIFGHNRKSMRFGVFPNHVIICIAQADLSDMEATGINIDEQARPSAEIDSGQTAVSYSGSIASLRSRSAANARQARMSSAVRSGKSASSSASDIPPARYSSTSVHRHARPANTRLPAPLARFDSNDPAVVHKRMIAKSCCLTTSSNTA